MMLLLLGNNPTKNFLKLFEMQKDLTEEVPKYLKTSEYVIEKSIEEKGPKFDFVVLKISPIHV